MKTTEFDYDLPPGLIAQKPAEQRDQSRLLVLARESMELVHRQFRDFPEYLSSGDVLVLNNSKVIPARLRGRNQATGGRFEILLVEENATNDWWAMLRPGKRARIGSRIQLTGTEGSHQAIHAIVVEINEEGHRRLRFEGVPNILDWLGLLGEVPLPPYVRREGNELRTLDLERYQTLYAGPPGSVAAPTAGLHFTENLLDRVREKGVRVCYLTLHVGLGTFAPVKTEDIENHRMHEERYEIPAETAAAITSATERGKRILAVGTTTVRVLESVALAHQGRVVPTRGRTQIFIRPPAQFKVVGGLLTNFHLPRSTLLMLVSAFAAPGGTQGRELTLKAYAEAIQQRYRFFSYGDAMLLL